MRRFLFMVIFVTMIFAKPWQIFGVVTDAETQNPISNVEIVVVNTSVGTITNDDGKFEILWNSERTAHLVVFSHISYEEINRQIYNGDKIFIKLNSKTLIAPEVEVLANRAVAGVTPVAFSTLTAEEIQNQYTIEDVPMILASEPGVYSYSESGNGTGYSYVSIRGFDQSRISVMMDNVPLNDNESHQVYWVDHGDILSDAQDVQIQRGVGNSLYGSAAFGGSINVLTNIASDEMEFSGSMGFGSFGTSKKRAKFNSGKLFGDNLSLTVRYTDLASLGYRMDSESQQNAFFTGIEHRTNFMTNQFRALVGYENSRLQWDGISQDMLSDPIQRKSKMSWTEPFTDDFLQQIYSLNTFLRFSDEASFHNVAYLVNGSGYYEVQKYGRDFYSYNLDFADEFADSVELNLETDLLRRKWIVNQYFGVVPTWTWNKSHLRIDVGGEFRMYSGDHFGEASQFSNENLASHFGDEWHKYYQYFGEKISTSGFAHVMYYFPIGLRLIADAQYQGHRWTLEQEKIGHAAGHSLSADWDFINPRFGFVYEIAENASIFGNYGRSQKEPADNQIIEADDVWSEPKEAAAEQIDDFELGANLQYFGANLNLNLYRINYANQVLYAISEEEGEYEISANNPTVHQGIEFEIDYSPMQNLAVSANGSLSQNCFTTDDFAKNRLPNVPSVLLNGSADYTVMDGLSLFSGFRYVGRQFIDNANTEDLAISPFSLVNFGVRAEIGTTSATFKINNLLNSQYATFGYEYWGGYYWPGAERSYFANIEFGL